MDSNIKFTFREILSSISTNVEVDKTEISMKLAFFNSIAIIIVFIIFITTSCVYFILQPFIKPLLWALLCGSALHPVKEILAQRFTNFLILLESSEPSKSNVPFIFLSSISKFVDKIGDLFMYYLTFLAKCFAFMFFLSIIYFYTPDLIVRASVLWMVLCKSVVVFFLDFFSSFVVVGTLILAYIFCLVLFWKPELKYFYSFASIMVWVAISSYICGFFSYLRFVAFVFIHLTVFGCYFYSTITDKINIDERDKEMDAPDSGEGSFFAEAETSLKETPGTTYDSMKYIRYLAVLCTAVAMFSLPTLLYVLIVFLAIYLIKFLVVKFAVIDFIYSYIEKSELDLCSWYSERKRFLIPKPLEYNFKVLQMYWEKIIGALKASSDSIAAVAVILCLLLFVFFASFFLVMQAYREGMYMVQTGGSIINRTVVHNPELQQLLPDDWESTLDTALNNTYTYIREALANVLRGLAKDKGVSETRATELERDVLELWDRAYQAWVVPLQSTKKANEQGPSVTAEAVIHSFQNFVAGLRRTPEVASLKSLGTFLSDNMATLTTSFDSVWSILRGNMSLLLSLITTCVSLLFGGSLSLINFVFNVVIFLTALFYLLSSSREMYKPVELITSMSPSYGNKLALVVEDACQGVLAASAKLSLFYALWTWLIHTLFQSNLVYMPTIFAGVMGVVPVLGPYWACLPAMLDLWLVQESTLLATSLLLAQVLPTFIVDATIYKEMRGGHPYLTGLSVAGGIFWLGLEGAIIGPLLLCFLFVMIRLLTQFNELENCNNETDVC